MSVSKSRSTPKMNWKKITTLKHITRTGFYVSSYMYKNLTLNTLKKDCQEICMGRRKERKVESSHYQTFERCDHNQRSKIRNGSGWGSGYSGGAEETSDAKPGAFLKSFATPHSLQKTSSGMLKVNPRVTCDYINQTERRTKSVHQLHPLSNNLKRVKMKSAVSQFTFNPHLKLPITFDFMAL